MKYRLPLIALVFFLGCTDKGAPAQREPAAVSTESPAAPVGDSGGLVGTWELVEQKGYGPDHPKDVEQTLTFDGNGHMRNVQSAGGTPIEMVLTYRIEGDQIKASVVSITRDGKPLDVTAGVPEQTYSWRIEGGRLILEGSQQGTQDIYERAD